MISIFGFFFCLFMLLFTYSMTGPVRDKTEKVVLGIQAVCVLANVPGIIVFFLYGT